MAESLSDSPGAIGNSQRWLPWASGISTIGRFVSDQNVSKCRCGHQRLILVSITTHFTSTVLLSSLIPSWLRTVLAPPSQASR